MNKIWLLLYLLWGIGANDLFGQYTFDNIITISKDSAKALKSVAQNPKEKCLATYQVGRKFIQTNVDSSIYYIEKAIDLAESINDNILINRMKKTLTYSLIDNQRMREAEEILYEIKPFYQSYKNGELYESWCNNIGYLMTENGRYDEAIIYLTDAFDIASKNNDYRSINDLLNRIGIVYDRMGMDGRALEYYEQVIYNAESLDEKNMYSAALYNAAVIVNSFGKVEKAKEYLRKMIKLRKGSSSLRIKYSVLNAESLLAELEGDLNKAIEIQIRALALVRSSNRKSNILTQYLKLEELYGAAGNITLSEEYLKKAYSLSQSVENVANQRSLLTKYSRLMSKKQNYREAYAIMATLDSIENERRLKEAEGRMIKLEISEVQRLRKMEYDQLKTEAEAIKIELDKKENERLFLIVLSVLLVAMLGLIYWISQNRKQNNIKLAEKNEIIVKSLEEKNTLMKEIHHRVKNNLQIVSSMLSLQLRYINDKAAKDVMIESRDRVKSMALLHQKLYQEETLKGVFMPTYIESLLSSLANSYKLDTLQIDLDSNVDDLWIDVDSAMPIGMIINELTTNAIKHAFNDQNGKIRVLLNRTINGLLLAVSDNGQGINELSNLKNQHYFGFKMINSFLRKLKGTIDIQNDNGTTVAISIKKYKEVQI